MASGIENFQSCNEHLFFDFRGMNKMKSICRSVITALFVTMILFPAATWAAKAYVSDPKETSLRAGPGQNYKVLAAIPSGSSLEVLKSAEWIQVRFVGPGGETKEGWVQNSAVAAYPPESGFVKELQSENAQINEKLASLEKEKVELVQREKDLTEKLKKSETAYESLKSGSTNFVKMKEECDAVKSALVSAEENTQALIQENEDLKFSARIRWFVAGAIVLLFGWLLGWLTSRSQRKRRSQYTF
jgi:SH3 domain protein